MSLSAIPQSGSFRKEVSKMNKIAANKVKRPWMLWWHAGKLYGKGAKRVSRIKSFFVPLQAHMSSFAGCNFEGRQFMRLQGVVDSNGSLTILIHNTQNKSTASFKIKPEEKCGITYDGKNFCKEELPPSIFFHISGEFVPINVVTEKIPLKQTTPKVSVGLLLGMYEDKVFSSPGYWQNKPVPSKAGEQRSVLLYNDGRHLYVKHGCESLHLLFRLYRKDVPCYLIPGFHFPEPLAVFKTFGHTLNGRVVVSIRHLQNEWSLVFSIEPNTSAIVYDVGTDFRIAFLK